MANERNKKSWKEQYALDIPFIDKQHMYFFKLFDKINYYTNTESDYDELKKYIEKLENYTRLHFQMEESLMKKADYNDYKKHVHEHELFINKIKEFKIDYNYNNPLLANKIVTFMRKWLIIHISETDRNYVPVINEMLVNNHLIDEIHDMDKTEYESL